MAAEDILAEPRSKVTPRSHYDVAYILQPPISIPITYKFSTLYGFMI